MYSIKRFFKSRTKTNRNIIQTVTQKTFTIPAVESNSSDGGSVQQVLYVMRSKIRGNFGVHTCARRIRAYLLCKHIYVKQIKM